MTSNYAIVDDDAFRAFAKQAEAEAKASNGNFGSSFQREYEDIKWTGLEKNVWSIVRVVSGYPNAGLDSSTARAVTISKIIDDNGKQMKVIRPSFSADPNYIINRIISAVKKSIFVTTPGSDKSTKKYPVQEQFPKIFNQIDKNGLDPSDKRYIYDKGWAGSEVLIMNVIDRKQMDWHKVNKHTMLLAKGISESNGKEFVEEGISWFATEEKLRHYLTSYGSWEKYDLGFKRTGLKSDAYIITNVSNSPLEVDEESRQYISMTDHLTDEELSWERYDLDKIYRITTATKIYNRLKNTIKRIDEALGTTFYNDLLKEVEKEKETFAELYPKKNEVTESEYKEMTSPKVDPIEAAIPAEESLLTEAPKTRRAVSSRTLKPWQELPFGEALPEYRREQILAVKKDSSGKIVKIEWDPSVGTLWECPDPNCRMEAPEEDIPRCPACGYDFSPEE